jgi:hypothetical protein
LQRSISKQHLSLPGNPSTSDAIFAARASGAGTADCEKTLVLARSQSPVVTPQGAEEEMPAYQGTGYGFEVVKWQGERFMRVGRVVS